MRRAGVGRVCGLALVFTGGSALGGVGQGASRVMPEYETIIAKVASCEQPDEGPAELRLSDGSTCRLDRADSRFPTWWKILEEERQADHVVYVECLSAERRVRWLSRFWEERIRKVASEPDGGKLKVWITGSPSIYHIKTARPGYEERRRLLEESAQSQKPVLAVTAELEILEARWP